MDIDPKLSWALRNPQYFPVDINTADKPTLARIPGLGISSVRKIISARKYRALNWEHLRKIGVALNRAKYFIVCNSRDWERGGMDAERIKGLILQNQRSKYHKVPTSQLNLFEHPTTILNQ